MHGKIRNVSRRGLSVERLESRNLLSVTPQMLSNADDANVSPYYGWAAFPDKILLAGEVDRSGTELLILEGDGSSPRLIKDVFPGSSSSNPADFVEMDGVIYFTAESGEFGRELWRTDGTAEGTRIVFDVAPGPAWSQPLRPTIVGNRLFFSADDGVHGRETWVTDGTAEGTRLVKDIAEGAASSDAYVYAAYHDAVFFSANDLEHGNELWRAAADGTDAQLFRDINPGPGGSNAVSFAVANDRLYFSAFDQQRGFALWQSDGTPDGTQVIYQPDIRIESSHELSHLTEIGGRVFFTKKGVLWASDGTTQGTISYGNSGTYYFGDVGGKAVFQSGWSAVYAWDGTDAAPPTYLGEGSNLQFGDGYAVFTKQDATGRSLWRTEGVAGDIVKLMDFPPLEPDSVDGELLATGLGKAYFVNLGSSRSSLWSASVEQYGEPSFVGDVFAGNARFFSASPPIEYQGRTYLLMSWTGHYGELWRTDGTAQGTVPIDVAPPEAEDTHIGAVASTSLGILLGRVDEQFGYELWVSDGTPAGLRLIKDIVPGSGGSYVQQFWDLGGTVLFVASDPTHGYELWRTDGTAAGTTLIKDINPGAANGFPNIGALINGVLYFSAVDAAAGQELWRSDGTPEGTYRVADISPSGDASPWFITPFAGQVFFAALGANDHFGLWRSDGTAAGTVLVREFGPEDERGFPSELTVVGDRLFFNAAESAHGRELWVTDGTSEGTRLVKDINPTGDGFSDDAPRYLLPWQGCLVFSADDGVHGRELWKTDGTAEGTVLIKDVRPGADGSNVQYLGAVNDRFVFSANDGEHGEELWISDGTPQGTRLFYDVSPGLDGLGTLRDSTPQYQGLIDGYLLFTAADNGHGRQLYSVRYDAIDLPGDADLDGDVDLTDFGILKHNFGTGTTRAEGDFNGDGRVDLTDFGILKAAFGASAEENVENQRSEQTMLPGAVRPLRRIGT